MKIKLLMLVGLFVIGFAMSASAGAVADADGDGVPDAFDNCLNVSNGPLTVAGCTAQENSDGDAFGDACDGDYNQDGFVTGPDFADFFAAFLAGVPSPKGEDANCDGFVTGPDFASFFAGFLQGTPGP